jgi:hypothetical protein
VIGNVLGIGILALSVCILVWSWRTGGRWRDVSAISVLFAVTGCIATLAVCAIFIPVSGGAGLVTGPVALVSLPLLKGQRRWLCFFFLVSLSIASSGLSFVVAREDRLCNSRRLPMPGVVPCSAAWHTLLTGLYVR